MESSVRFMFILSRILVINGQVTPSIFTPGSEHSRSPHGQFFVNIWACTCMYAITRTLPEFKSVSSSHVSRPLVRIAAAPGGLSRNRGADQVTRTTRVANAHSITSDPHWTAWKSRQTGGLESFKKNGHMLTTTGNRYAPPRDVLSECLWYRVPLCAIMCHCVPLFVTVYHCVSLFVTMCPCHCEPLPPNYWADYASLGEWTPTLYVLRNKNAGKFPTKNFDLFLNSLWLQSYNYILCLLGPNKSYLMKFSFFPSLYLPFSETKYFSYPNIFLIIISLFLLRVNISLHQLFSSFSARFSIEDQMFDATKKGALQAET